MRRRLIKTSTLTLVVLCLGGCAPHFYRGRVAIVNPATEISVTQRLKDWGNCHRRFGEVPIAYQIQRPSYEVVFAHGDRHWPEFYLLALDRSGRELSLSGDGIEPIKYRSGVYLQHLSASRRFTPSHMTTSKDLQGPLDIAITDSLGTELGHEKIAFSLESTSCFQWDGI